MCYTMIVQRFEPQGGRFTNFYYYYIRWYRRPFRLIHRYKKLFSPFAQYIEKGNLQKRLWSWKYSGGAKLKRKDRILGQYNQTTVSGVLVHRGLRVTYRYIDPRDDSRLEGDALVITCTDPNFKAYQDFPETVCGM